MAAAKVATIAVQELGVFEVTVVEQEPDVSEAAITEQVPGVSDASDEVSATARAKLKVEELALEVRAVAIWSISFVSTRVAIACADHSPIQSRRRSQRDLHRSRHHKRPHHHTRHHSRLPHRSSHPFFDGGLARGHVWQAVYAAAEVHVAVAIAWEEQAV